MPWEINWELYNLEIDRCETNNIADQETELVKRLGREWIQYAKRVKLHPFDQ